MILIKTPEEIEIIAEGGKILAKIMKELEKNVKPGITTKELDRLAESLISSSSEALAKEDKIKCSFKGYVSKDGDTVRPYPACLCTSVNEEIVHAVPSERILKEGDILKLDLGLVWKGFHSDMAITVPVGRHPPTTPVSFEAQRLIRVTKKALKLAIKKAKPGNTFGDIGNTIQRYVESQGFNVVRELCGHGIGRELHEDPQILNYGKRKSGEEIKEGMVFCLEPMVTVGDWHIKRGKDGYSCETIDNSLSAHFEHMMTATKEGPKILTLP